MNAGRAGWAKHTRSRSKPAPFRGTRAAGTGDEALGERSEPGAQSGAG